MGTPFPDAAEGDVLISTYPHIREQFDQILLDNADLYSQFNINTTDQSAQGNILSCIQIAAYLELFNGRLDNAVALARTIGFAGHPIMIRALTLTSYLPIEGEEERTTQKLRIKWTKEAANLVKDQDFPELHKVPYLAFWHLYARMRDLDLRKKELGGPKNLIGAFSKIYSLCGELCSAHSKEPPELTLMKMGMQAAYLHHFKGKIEGGGASKLFGAVMSGLKAITDLAGATHKFQEADVLRFFSQIKESNHPLCYKYVMSDSFRKLTLADNAIAGYKGIAVMTVYSAEEVVYQQIAKTRTRFADQGKRDKALLETELLIPHIWSKPPS